MEPRTSRPMAASMKEAVRAKRDHKGQLRNLTSARWRRPAWTTPAPGAEQDSR